MLSTHALCGWIMFYSIRWLLAETWKKILHGRNVSNTLVNSKKSWSSKNHPSRDILPKLFWNVLPLHLRLKSLEIPGNNLIFSKVACLKLATLLKKNSFTRVLFKDFKYRCRIRILRNTSRWQFLMGKKRQDFVIVSL